MIGHRPRRDQTGSRAGILAPMRRFLLLSATFLVCLSACRAKLASTLQVDGKAFTPTECRSGQFNNFQGVDLINGSVTLRLVQSPANKPSAILIEGDTVTELGECGKMTSQQQNSEVNGIVNVQGSATLECKHEQRSLTGTISFQNCH
jgi:hypothetical protein